MKTILLVEDQRVIALVEKALLEKAGYTVNVVENGEEAVRVALHSSDIDLILMDIDLGPGIDGTQAAQQILAERTLPIVFLSSHTEPEVVQKTEGITSYGYVVKNSGDTVLLASLRMAFRLAEADRELKKSQKKLEVSEQRFRTVMDSMQDIVFTLDTEKRHTAVYGPWVERHGLEAEHFLGRTFQEILGPEATLPHDQAFDKAIAGTFTIYDWQVPSADGTRYFQTSLSPIKNSDGKVEGVVGVGRDITDQVRATESQKKSESYLQTVLDTTLVGFWIVTPEGRLSHVNKAYSKMSGYSIAELETMVINDLEAIEDPVATMEHLEKIKSRGFDIFETKHRRKDGSFFGVEVSVSRFDTGKDLQLICFCNDITEAKALRAEVQRRSEILDKLSHQLPGAVYLYQLFPDGHFSLPFGSEKFYDLYGIDSQNLRDTTDLVFERIISEDREKIRDSIQYSAKTIEIWEEEYQILHPSRGKRWLRGSSQPELQGDGSILWYGYIEDVTESKNIEQSIWENQERWHIALDSAGAAIWDWHPQDDSIFLSANFSELLGYQSGEQSASFSEIQALFHPDDLPVVLKAMDEYGNSSTSIFEYQARMKSNLGGWRWILGRGKVLEKDTQGNALRIIGVTTDISELKDAQARIEQLLQEQSTLLKETHHRIKNNFASAESLLNLQTHTNTPPEAREIIDGARSRISSMRILYDKLVNTENFECIPLQAYLTELVSTIGKVYIHSQNLNLETDIEPLDIRSKLAFPLGAIVVELVTNSIKYAYPEGKTGTIRVSLTLDGSTAVLEVSDHGQGYDPKKTTGRSESLGLTLVKMMTTQIRGTLASEAVPGKGTRTVVRFEV